jgi:DNA topoisomerase-1
MYQKKTVSNPSQADLLTDPLETAKAAGLRYVNDARPGITRRRAGKDFVYYKADGTTLDDSEILRRIKALAIPPAWTQVWICPSPNGHLQATARDAKGRKQYRYHKRWREVRDETKYERLLAFGEALPLIRKRVKADLALQGMPREKILATLVRLLETTFIRIGNEEYARANKSFGLTTLRNRHVDIHGAKIRFQFRGKSGKQHSISLTDKRLAKIVKRCQDLPGQELFQYLDEDGQVQSIGSADVNQYLREITNQDFTAKDFRTWAGTVLAALALKEMNVGESETEAKKNIVQAIQSVSEKLGNTPAVCRKCYVHPAVLDAYLDRSLVDGNLNGGKKIKKRLLRGLRVDECFVLNLLRKKSGARSK